jgi:hypothetical protein
MQPGFPHAKTRRREECGLMDAHAAVDAHPLRPRCGTKPAVLHGVADPKSLPSLRVDLGQPASPSRPSLRPMPPAAAGNSSEQEAPPTHAPLASEPRRDHRLDHRRPPARPGWPSRRGEPLSRGRGPVPGPQPVQMPQGDAVPWPPGSLPLPYACPDVGRVPSRGGQDAALPSVSGAGWQRHPAAGRDPARAETALPRFRRVRAPGPRR